MARCDGFRVQGFTTIELMVVVTVLTILAAIAVPSLHKFSVAQRVKTAGFELQSALLEARSEAIARNADVSVAPLGSGWAEGWTTTVGGVQIKQGNPQKSVAISGPGSVVFRANGRPTSVLPLSVSAADVAADDRRCVRLHLNGRSYLEKGACS